MRKWNELEWDFHWFSIIRTDWIIDRNALSDSIPASFGAKSNTACVVVTRSIPVYF